MRRPDRVDGEDRPNGTLPMTPKAVLFDFDGVIADTENVHVTAWQRTMSRLGWELTDEAATRSAEIDDRAFLAELFAGQKIEDGDLDGWLRHKQELAESLLADAPRIYPGVVPLVEALRSKGIRLAVVTTTWRRNVEVVLDAAKLADAFELIIAKEDVAAFKPAPDGYRLALERLRLKASEAVAIEDSPSGLEAARGAGIRVVAVGHRRPAGDWAGDHPYLATLTPVDTALDSIGIL
jgi:beta-phosphoglucomutase